MNGAREVAADGGGVGFDALDRIADPSLDGDARPFVGGTCTAWATAQTNGARELGRQEFDLLAQPRGSAKIAEGLRFVLLGSQLLQSRGVFLAGLLVEQLASITSASAVGGAVGRKLASTELAVRLGHKTR